MAGPARPGIPEEFSLYLDVVRFVAALVVLITHANIRALSDAILPGAQYGHSAVVVFFVLSGFVIAYVTATREVTARDYAISRIARIYSVAVPALLLTIVLDTIGRGQNLAVYAGTEPYDRVAVRLASSLLLLNESWGLSIQMLSNGPYWSINYEGWFYILFGLVLFVGPRHRRWVLASACVICGPKVLLLLPVWLLGVWLYRATPPAWLTPVVGGALFVLSALGIGAFHHFHLDLLGRRLAINLVGAQLQRDTLTYAGSFPSDYLLGILVTLHFAGFRAASRQLGRVLLPFRRSIRWAAGFTLSLYLFHRPLILFFTACLPVNPAKSGSVIGVIGLVLLCVYPLALATERQKGFYRQLTRSAFDSVDRRFRRHGLPPSSINGPSASA